ncbi:MAG: UbiA family prenyltransferase [Chitinophagaceae bacterium]
MLKSIFNFFLFSSLYIAFCAVVMVYQVHLLFPSVAIAPAFYVFVFFSTICSYNFHWWLTNHSATSSERLTWALQYKWLHLVLYFVGLIGAGISFVMIRQHWLWIAIGAFVTFLYSAPKIPQKIFIALRRIAVGKTIFLAFVWMYITTLLPVLISNTNWQHGFTWLACSRFFLIYAICILFDYRDREDDKADGIRSMITWFNERGIDNLFAGSLLLFLLFTTLLYRSGHSIFILILLLVPGILVAALYRYAKTHFSDYLYYFVLDGLMMLSGLLMIVGDI